MPQHHRGVQKRCQNRRLSSVTDHRSTQIAAQGTRNVSENISGVRADADSAAAAADDVKQASETLESQSQTLSGQVTEFLTRIRAA